MKKFFAIIFLAAIFATLSACGNIRENIVRGEGDRVLREIDVRDFSGLDINGGWVLTFIQSPVFFVTVEMQENLFEHLNTEVTNGVLNIGSRRAFRTVAGNTPHLRVYAPDLDSISVAGAIDAEIDLDTDTLQINVAGAANMELWGSAEYFDIIVAGAANINAFDFFTAHAVVDMAGAGDVEVYASQSLDARISGAGSIRFDGDPESVSQNIAGFGTISSR